jgi:hypothetical protein
MLLARATGAGSTDPLANFLRECHTGPKILLSISLTFPIFLRLSSGKPEAYIPHAAPSYVYCALFVALTLVFLFHICRRREWWALCLPVGTLSESPACIDFLGHLPCSSSYHPPCSQSKPSDMSSASSSARHPRLAITLAVTSSLCLRLSPTLHSVSLTSLNSAGQIFY